ncbi:hypothetical protein DESA109040_20285 [Deinococcus saxicola]|uniref:hypothetical protein n=1 Tax=Deinococcus saxicola TaxID=249406 RepID=UPI0039F023AB
MSLPGWVYGPFELLLHAELHYRAGGDFDRRIALISFDNSIEVAVMNYLSLDEIHRNGRKYKKEDRERWMDNYFSTKLDFIEYECSLRKIPMSADKPHMTWYHKVRNKQYHEGEAAIPTNDVLSGIRTAAIWVFGMLYEVSNVEEELSERIKNMTPTTDLPERDEESDKILDDKYGVIWFGRTSVYASDLIYSHDPNAYRDEALNLREEHQTETEDAQ